MEFTTGSSNIALTIIDAQPLRQPDRLKTALAGSLQPSVSAGRSRRTLGNFIYYGFDMTTNDSPEQWPPANCPPLAWPTLSNDIERLAWYRAVIDAYSALWEGHVTQAKLAPVREPLIN